MCVCVQTANQHLFLCCGSLTTSNSAHLCVPSMMISDEKMRPGAADVVDRRRRRRVDFCCFCGDFTRSLIIYVYYLDYTTHITHTHSLGSYSVSKKPALLYERIPYFMNPAVSLDVPRSERNASYGNLGT